MSVFSWFEPVAAFGVNLALDCFRTLYRNGVPVVDRHRYCLCRLSNRAPLTPVGPSYEQGYPQVYLPVGSEAASRLFKLH
jgi:hypothetical protein